MSNKIETLSFGGKFAEPIKEKKFEFKEEFVQTIPTETLSFGGENDKTIAVKGPETLSYETPRQKSKSKLSYSVRE